MTEVVDSIGRVTVSTERLLTRAAAIEPAALAGPSLLPGWTRAHVLAHLAGNARSHVRMLDGAAAGELRPQYASTEARAAEIEDGAHRPAPQILADLRTSCAALAERWTRLPSTAWENPVAPLNRTPRSAYRLLWQRLRELEVHHVDLAAGYRPADWPDGLADGVLDEVAAAFVARAETPVFRLVATDLGRCWDTGEEPEMAVAGPSRDLCAWVTGRDAGADLSTDPEDTLPTPPRWS
ncbi:MAG: maleylpyruvate isomerase family mycothiol-dependent enzyme [Mycobacteriales bacterium]